MKKILKQLPVIFPGLKNYQSQTIKESKVREKNLLFFFLNQLIFAFFAIRLSMNISTEKLNFIQSVKSGFQSKRHLFDVDLDELKPEIIDQYLDNIKVNIEENIFFLKENEEEFMYLHIETEVNGFDSTNVPSVLEREDNPDKYFYDTKAFGEKTNFYNIKSKFITDHQQKLDILFDNHKDFLKEIEVTSYVNSVVFYSFRFKCLFYLEFVVVVNNILYETNFIKLMHASNMMHDIKKMTFSLIITFITIIVIIIACILAYFQEKKKIIKNFKGNDQKIAGMIRFAKIVTLSKIIIINSSLILSNLLINNFYIPMSTERIQKKDFKFLEELNLFGTILNASLFLLQGLRIFFLFEFNKITNSMLKVYSNSFHYIGFVVFQLVVLILSFGLFHSIVDDTTLSPIMDHMVVSQTITIRVPSK